MEMVEVDTDKLVGAALDYAIACCLEEYEINELYGVQMVGEVEPGINFKPSTDWAQCGPLIEKYRIGLDHIDSDWHGEPLNFWVAPSHDTEGETPMIAACRAIVHAKLGETVLVPKELMP